jgi:hypothetical protein
MATTAELIVFIISTLIVLLAVRIFIYLINRAVRLQRLSVDIINGLKVLVRIIGFLIIILLLFIFFDVSTEALISISSVGGIFIGFASSEVMSQVVSGLYLISAKPFGIHDLVKIDDVTGLVMEIGLNHTVLQKVDGNIVKIPNKMILDSKIKNYTIKLPDEIKRRQAHLKRSEQVPVKHVNPEGARKGKIDWKKLRVILDDLADFAFEDEITRFIFRFDVDFSIPPKKVKERLEKVCKKYEPIFEYLPQYRLIDMDFRAEFEMVVFCFSPFIIIHNYDAFLNDIATVLYSDKEDDM